METIAEVENDCDADMQSDEDKDCDSDVDFTNYYSTVYKSKQNKICVCDKIDCRCFKRPICKCRVPKCKCFTKPKCDCGKPDCQCFKKLVCVCGTPDCLCYGKKEKKKEEYIIGKGPCECKTAFCKCVLKPELRNLDKKCYCNLPVCTCIFNQWQVDDEEIICHCNDPICTCFDVPTPKECEISPRKERILNIESQTQEYIQNHRINDLIHFLTTKLLVDAPENPVSYLGGLLDACMLFRSGHGVPPILYEKKHLEAVIKSFDPMNRGYLTAGQVNRAYTTLSLKQPECFKDKVPTDKVLEDLICDQNNALFELVSAGYFVEKN